MDAESSTSVKKKSKGHRCYFCGEKFLEVNLLKKHITSHKERPYSCDLCGRTFTNNNVLKKHRFVHFEEQRYQCEVCGNRFRQRWTLKMHLKKHNINEVKFCITCGKNVRSFTYTLCSDCRIKGKDVTDDGKFHCNTCTLVFDTAEDLNKHAVLHGDFVHTVKEYHRKTYESVLLGGEDCCLTCGKKSLKGVLCVNCKIKGRRVTDDGKFHCVICTLNFETAADLNTHVMSSSDYTHRLKEQQRRTNNTALSRKRSYACTTCDKDCETLTNLKEHLLIHGDRPFTCRQCNAKFKTTHSLWQHKAVHNENCPYICEICSSSFKSPFALQQHSLSHKEDRPYLCDICGNNFKSPCSLKKHLTTHLDIRPYICDVCGNSFKSSFCLKQHLITHGKERPYSCNLCDKTFKSSSNYGRHRRSHTGECPYICVICNKSYSQANSLRIHLMTHKQDEKPKQDVKRSDVRSKKAGENEFQEPFQEMHSYSCLIPHI